MFLTHTRVSSVHFRSRTKVPWCAAVRDRLSAGARLRVVLRNLGCKQWEILPLYFKVKQPCQILISPRKCPYTVPASGNVTPETKSGRATSADRRVSDDKSCVQNFKIGRA